MELIVKQFDALTTDELYELLRLRVDVFVVEQRCPYPELDGLDKSAYHVFLRDDEGMEAYLRVLRPGTAFPEAGIGRVIAKKRRQGLGTQILRAGIAVARENFHASAIRLDAQVYARSLYEKAGFRPCTEEFLEDGIPHIGMKLE